MIIRFIDNGEIEREERCPMDIPEDGMEFFRSLKKLVIKEMVLDKDELNKNANMELEEDVVFDGMDVAISTDLTEFGEPVMIFDVTTFNEILNS